MNAPPRKRFPILPALIVGALVLVGSSCICCIVWGSRGTLERERQAQVGSAARLISLRARLDRVHDAFPVQPVASACTEAPPAEPVIVLAYSGLHGFRRGQGDVDLDDSELHVTSTFLRGHDRPPDDIDDADAYARIDSLVSSVRPLMDARWVAVMRATEVRRPAVTFDVFAPGHYQGWLVIFELTSGRVLCAQPVAAQNSASVDVSTFQRGSDAALQDLATNLATERERARIALSPELRLSF